MTLYHKTLGSIWQKKAPQQPKKILFIKLIEQGSNVITYDTLMEAKSRVGVENLYFWIFEENKAVLDLLEVVPQQNIFSVRTDSAFRFAGDLLKSLWRIRKLKIDTVIDMEFYARAPALLSYMTGAPRRVGVDRFNAEAPYRGVLATHKVQYNAYIHTAKFFRLLLESAYLNPSDTPLPKLPVQLDEPRLKKFEPKPGEKEELVKILRSLREDILDGPIILLNANASDMIPLRKWDNKKYIELGERILQRYPDSTIVLTGAPSEADPINKLVRQFKSERVVSVAGKTSFRQLIVLYTLADLMVTNDSGPSHFSGLTKMACVTLFGPETPLLYQPLGEDKTYVSANLACSPCVNVLNHRFSACQNNVCMQKISVEEVFQKVTSLLDRRLGKKESRDFSDEVSVTKNVQLV